MPTRDPALAHQPGDVEQRARDAARVPPGGAGRRATRPCRPRHRLRPRRGERHPLSRHVLRDRAPLDDRIAEEGPLSIEETASVGVQIASILGSVHAREVVHRDLKGSNVVIRTDGVVKVLDFGVAAFLDPDTTGLTTTGERPGSLECMAPEQVQGKPVDPRTDLYALGCLLYAMLTGEPVFAHESELMLPGMILEQPPVPPGRLRAGISSELEDLVLQLLAKDPDERPAHAGEVWRRLAVWLPERRTPEQALVPWAEVDPLRPSPTRWGPKPGLCGHGQHRGGTAAPGGRGQRQGGTASRRADPCA
ncbi:serine/threonine-protein kinase [Kitasatospora purpeofusca]|uniref:serine/threonine-protein kinase n=1 Tax=Kitasatospora purpeofusca TaxID=67352 RepID=UPI0036D2F9CA